MNEPVKQRIVIHVPMPTPSLNEFAYSSRWKVKSIQDKWVKMLWALIGTNREKFKAAGKRNLTIVRRGKRMLDMDNLYGGAKPVVDAIKSLGLIVDDDEKSIALVVTQAKLQKNEPANSQITIEDCA